MKKIRKLLSLFNNKSSDNLLLQELQDKINYHFKDQTLLISALTHTSVSSSIQYGSAFERMEFLGDSILGLIVAEELFVKFPKYSEGELSKLKSQIVSRIFLTMKAKQIGLGNYIHLSSEAKESGGQNSSSIISDAMESLICAIYLDGYIQQARKFIKKIILKNFESAIKSSELINYKSILQEYTQSKYQSIPVYKIIQEKGPDHEKVFTIEVYINGKKFGVGKGSNKKETQQNAAKEACSILKL